METRIIIAGSRTFSDYELLKRETDKVMMHVEMPVIVSGGARGADTLGERYAKEHGVKLIRFLAEWEKDGVKAGYIRNTRMAEYASKTSAGILLAFWNGRSRGTRDMIDKARQRGMKVHIVRYAEEKFSLDVPHKGVFWLVDGEIWAYPFQEKLFPSAITKMGDSYVHKKLWKKVKPKSCNHPYNYYPRGRVEITSKGSATIYMNPNIEKMFVAEITRKFGLTSEPKVVYDNSDHYKSYLDIDWKEDKTKR